MKNNNLGELKGGEIKLSVTGRILAILVAVTCIAVIVFTTGGYLAYKSSNTVTSAIQSTIDKSNDTKHTVNITKISKKDINSIMKQAKSNGYSNVKLLLVSNACQRCKEYKSDLATLASKTASKDTLLLIVNMENQSTRFKIADVFNLPEEYFFPTIISFPPSRQENGSRQDRLTKKDMWDYYEVTPLFQNRDTFYG